MAINQLFIKKPPEENLIKIFNCLGFSSLRDTKSFSQNTINNSYDKIFPLVLSLKKYYIPCKSILYFNNLNSKKIITLLKQCLKLYDYKLISKEVYFKDIKKKKIFYTLTLLTKNNIFSDSIERKITEVKYNNIILNFD